MTQRAQSTCGARRYIELEPELGNTRFDPARLPMCTFGRRPAAPLANIPRSARWNSNGEIFAALAEMGRHDGLVWFLRRGSLLEAYRGRRGDNDGDVHVVLPSGMSIGCFASLLRATLARSNVTRVESTTPKRAPPPPPPPRLALLSGWPLTQLWYNMFDTPIVVADGASVDIEVLSEELFARDSGFMTQLVASQPGWDPRSMVALLCRCSLPLAAPGVDVVCFDDPAASAYLARAYGEDFWIPLKRELAFELASWRWLFRTRVGKWLVGRVSSLSSSG